MAFYGLRRKRSLPPGGLWTCEEEPYLGSRSNEEIRCTNWFAFFEGHAVCVCTAVGIYNCS